MVTLYFNIGAALASLACLVFMLTHKEAYTEKMYISGLVLNSLFAGLNIGIVISHINLKPPL